MTIHSSGKVWTGSTREVAVEIDSLFPRKDWTSTYPGHGEISPSTGKANLGQYAVDFMVSSKALGDKIAAYAWKNRKRLGIRYVIWNRRIISETSSRPNKWVAYFDGQSSNPSRAHTNHVHVSRYSNKGYTAPAGTPVESPSHEGSYPKPTTKIVYVDKIKPGTKDSDSVYWLQIALGVKATGTYDDATVEAAKDWQRSLGDDVDGDLGPLQTAALFAAHAPGSSLGVDVEATS